jgi:hypothetical protein
MGENSKARHCPLCERTLKELSPGHYACAAHGEWLSYGPRLLLQAPRVERRGGLIPLPWESPTAA